VVPDALTADLLDELAARWRAIDAPIAHSLEPGLSEEAIDELGESVGLWIPAEARTLWRWRNGANLKFIVDDGGHSFRSLQHAIEWVETMRRIAHEVADSYGPRADKAKIARDVWNWNWLPLCSDGTRGMLVIDASMSTLSSSTSPVAYRAKDDGSLARPVADSIGSLVRLWIEVIDSGAVHLNPRGQPTVASDLLPSGFDRAIFGAP
jgi:cell wall assembly regulator SMI1